MAKSPYLSLTDLLGGINDADAPFAIDDKQVVIAQNVDYRAGNIGTKRGGLTALSLSGSVFSRDVPVMAHQDSGAWTGAAAAAATVAAFGASSVGHFLAVTIATNGAISGTPTFLGANMTLAGSSTNGGVTVYAYYVLTPNIAGGGIVVNLTGVCNGKILIERWTSVDTTATPAAFTSSTGVGVANKAQPGNSALSSSYIGYSGTTWASGAGTNDLIGGVVDTFQIVDVNARANVQAKLGMRPTTVFSMGITTGVAWATYMYGILGVPISTGRSLRAVMRFQPSNLVTEDELWLQDDYGRLDRRVAGVWQGGVPVQNYSVGSWLPSGFLTNGVSLHGKFFLALEGTMYADRTHVWDGTVLRWSGFSQPSPVTAADSGGAGTFASKRYYRMRYIQKVAGVVVRRSEPSTVLGFTPSGVNASATITKPAAGGFISGEGETDWELEASVDNVTFYVLATTVVGTTTVVDSTVFATGYATGSNLSPALTEYIPIRAGRHLVIDGDRLMLGGTPTGLIIGGVTYVGNNDSRIDWTPLRADTGVGNDERTPATSRFFLDLDGLSGGGLSHLLPASLGGIYALKASRVYKLIRAGSANPAYNSLMYSDARGCLPRAAAPGVDENGVPCVYFTDPNVGSCRLGGQGITDLMQTRRTVVARINKAALLPGFTLFYPKHWLVWVGIAVDGANVPNLICCYNIRTKAWTDYTGNAAMAVSGVLFPDSVTQELRPYEAVSTPGTCYLVEADKGVNDDGVRYRAYVRSKAFILGGLFKEFSIDGAVLHAKAGAATITASVIRNLGVTRKDAIAVSIAAAGAETYVVVGIDDLALATMQLAQIELGDDAAMAGAALDQTWTLEALVSYVTGGAAQG